MAKDPKTEIKPPEEVAVAAAAPLKEIPRLYIILGIIGLIFFEAILLTFLIPSRESAKAAVEVLDDEIVSGKSGFKPPPIPEEKPVKVETLEKPFGKPDGEKFRINDVNRTDPSKQDGFTCSVYVVIKKSDETAFNKIYEKHVKQIDWLIQTILRESTLEERTESSLSVIRGRIKRRVSEDLGIPYILEILITDVQTESM